ncbi:MAG: hypothetical protein ACRENK_16555 [Gemmatimonadaceae bacterium]
MLFRGIIVGAASGKLGALVASHNKGGQYMRARVVPSGKVPTPFQSVVRNAVAGLVPVWTGELTDAQRTAWNVYAINVPGRNALGDPIQLSGQNWYIGSNTLRIQAGLPRVDDAPVIYNRGDVPWAPEVLAFTDDTGTISLNYAAGSLTGGDASIVLFQGKPFSNGRSKYYGSFRVVNVFNETDGSTATLAGWGGPNPFPAPSGTTNQECLQLVLLRPDGRYTSPSRITFQG